MFSKECKRYVTGDGMAGVDVGGAEDVVSDDGVDVVGGEEANL
ncbi:hypothetical protein Tco_0460088, partial [Tanacetum coccineum]